MSALLYCASMLPFRCFLLALLVLPVGAWAGPAVQPAAQHAPEPQVTAHAQMLRAVLPPATPAARLTVPAGSLAGGTPGEPGAGPGAATQTQGLRVVLAQGQQGASRGVLSAPRCLYRLHRSYRL